MLHREPSKRGQALVELALVAPLFFMVLMGIVVIGIGVFYQQQMSNAAREGARFAAIHSATSTCPTMSSIEPIDSVRANTYNNFCDPHPTWPKLRPHVRSKLAGLDPGAVNLSACWSGYVSPSGQPDAAPPAVDNGSGVRLRYRYNTAGGGITLQGMTASIETVSGTGTDTRVMIYSTDNPNYGCPGGHYTRCQGPLDFTANSTFNVKGLDDGPCPPITTSGSCPYAGMLMWQDGHGSDPDALVELGGQTNLNISGTIYAPKAEVRLTGGSAGTGVATVQIIAWRFDLGGGAVLRMPYDPGALYHVEERGLVH